MKKYLRVFFVVFTYLFVFISFLYADITTEIVSGSSVGIIVSLFEPKGSSNFIGTVELRGNTVVRCDVNGNVIYQATRLRILMFFPEREQQKTVLQALILI